MRSPSSRVSTRPPCASRTQAVQVLRPRTTRVCGWWWGLTQSPPAHGIQCPVPTVRPAPCVSFLRLVVGEDLEAMLPLAEMIDADKERARLGKQQASLTADIGKLEKRLASPGFVDKAKPAVVEKTRNELGEMKEKLAGVVAALAKLPA